MKSIIVLHLFIISVLSVAGCSPEKNNKYSSTDEAHKQIKNVDSHCHDDEEDHDHIDEITFTTQQAEAAGLQLETIVPATFTDVIRTSGHIMPALGDETIIAATSSGTVSFAGATFTDGVAVRAGEAIVVISSKNIQDGDPVIKTRVEFETAEKEYRRAGELVKEQVISTREYEQRRLEYEMAKNSFEALAAHATPGGVKVTSPIGGYIKNLMVRQGEYVSVGQTIATVSQNRRLQLRAEVPENHFKSLGNIESANFQTSYDNRVYKLSELNGRLLSFGKGSIEESSCIPVNFEFDNIGDIISGSYVTVYLLSVKMENVISVPVSALTEEQGLYFVYLQLDEEGYKKQEVKLGQSNGDRIRVLSGLRPGDRVVIRGVYQVKLAATSSVLPEGHTH